MSIIGEKINTARQRAIQAIGERNVAFMTDPTTKQDVQ
jgi:hypothetical protein